jgi:hypothetical protein
MTSCAWSVGAQRSAAALANCSRAQRCIEPCRPVRNSDDEHAQRIVTTGGRTLRFSVVARAPACRAAAVSARRVWQSRRQAQQAVTRACMDCSETESLGGLQVDHELELGHLLDLRCHSRPEGSAGPKTEAKVVAGYRTGSTARAGLPAVGPESSIPARSSRRQTPNHHKPSRALLCHPVLDFRLRLVQARFAVGNAV